MNNKQKIEKLKELTEAVKSAQARLEVAKKLEETLLPSSIGLLLEAELEQAEVLLAAKDFLSRLQKMAESLAKMQAESIPLGDSMKVTLGADAAKDFETTVTEAIAEGLAAVRAAKDKIADSITRVEGGEPNVDGEINSDMAETDEDEEVDFDDAFGGSDASSGPDDEPLGRGFKESLNTYGRKILESESLDGLVAWLYEDVSQTMTVAEYPKFQNEIGRLADADPERLAGWIGQRKYGKGLSAQLSSTLASMDADILDEGHDREAVVEGLEGVEEGKSFRFGDDEDEDVDAKKKFDREKRDSARAKRELEPAMAEGKSFRFGDDEDEDEYVDAKKKFDREKRDAARAKRELEPAMAEGKSFRANDEDGDADTKKRFDREKRGASRAKRTIEEAVRLIIERNIITSGKGQSVAAIAEAMSMFALTESTSEDLIESFTDEYGMSPRAYSLKRAAIVKEGVPLNQQDKKNAAGMMAKVAGDMTTDKNLGKKNVQTVMSKMDPKQRATAQKVINNAKAKGSQVNKVDDLVSATQGEIDENINSANWPVDTKGQYKGKPMSSENPVLPKRSEDDITVDAATEQPGVAKATEVQKKA